MQIIPCSTHLLSTAFPMTYIHRPCQLSGTLANFFWWAKGAGQSHQKDLETFKEALAWRDSKFRDLQGKVSDLEKKIGTVVLEYKDSQTFIHDAMTTLGLLATRIFRDQDIAEPFSGHFPGTNRGRNWCEHTVSGRSCSKSVKCRLTSRKL